MRKHITNLHGHSAVSTALISQQMTTTIAQKLDFNELAIYAYETSYDSDQELSKRLDGILAGLSQGDLVVVQLPTWNDRRFERALIDKIKYTFKAHLIVFIHDIPPIMFPQNYYLMSSLIEIYNEAELVIVPSQEMYQRLYLEGLRVDKVLIQAMWDHPTEFQPGKISFQKKIHFAGDINKFDFIKQWPISCAVDVYSNHGQNLDLPKEVTIKGWLPDYELLTNLSKGGFGLVWTDQDYIQDYFQMCITHKLSTYLAAGIPVFVPESLSNRKIIEDNGLGYVVKSLEEANEIIENMSESTYQELIDNVANFRQLIIQGYFTQRLLTATVFKIFSQGLSDFEGDLSHCPLMRKDHNIFILTAQDYLLHIDEIIQGLPNYQFHIAAQTQMSDRLLDLEKYPNVSLYPAAGKDQINSLLLKANIYLDINYGVEVEDIVTKASNLGLTVYSFEDYCHQLGILDPNNIFAQDNYQDLIDQIKMQEDRVKK
ncbi:MULTISPECIES: hypothetical protein [Aerococcus]|uniref:Glucosyltransferase 3 n=1 Tax=Aerococcus loyolae TaxID=2976809 RepID=A0ABT4C0R2_9LACT|nr:MULTISPECIES: hypothetical protein [Aerococcus]MCY3026097.1 hypothetical protein [Aerococcus loyolae]MCY3028034.1 hypothetical protein [Aerococcus loyolae]MCY3029356.1 hypothetical protein [Aerococcus loyolae]MDK6258207.1 hypothetical protein [Aerococcus urinae]MDK6294037.1 hypothetical protein [Aerococcus urinae]